MQEFVWIENIFWYYINIVLGLNSCTLSTGSFPGVKRPGRGADHAFPSSAEVCGYFGFIPTPLYARISKSWGDLYLLPQAYIGCCNITPVATGSPYDKFANEIAGIPDEPTEYIYIYIITFLT